VGASHQVQREMRTGYWYPHVHVLCLSSPCRRSTRCDARCTQLAGTNMPLCFVSASSIPASHQVRHKMGAALRYRHGMVLCLSSPRGGVAPGATRDESNLPRPLCHCPASQFPPWRRCTRCDAIWWQPSNTHLTICYVHVPPCWRCTRCNAL
jgi:hypothetical protein